MQRKEVKPIFKKLTHTYDDVEARYIEGTVLDKIITPSQNYLIMTSNCEHVNTGYGMFKKYSRYPEQNFLVPKRRVRVVNKLKYLRRGKRYCFKLTKESRSKKFVVSSIFQRVIL